MASLKIISRSAFFVLQYRDEGGRWRTRSLRLRHDDPADQRAALRICEEQSARERMTQQSRDLGTFADWVPDFIEGHYSRESSRARYQHAWKNLREWMRLRKIAHPAHVRYHHAADYMDWRIVQSNAGHNTARLEIKFLSMLVTEATRRGFVEANPLALARIEKKSTREKMEVDSAGFTAIRKALETAPEWMHVVFEVMAHTGCRFAETDLHGQDLDFAAGVLWITDAKRQEGDARKRFAAPMSAPLKEFLWPIRERERILTVQLSAENNRRFNAVLKGAAGVTSHSLRVSFVSRCHRAGLGEAEAMRLINHSSRLVHRIYSRLNVSDAVRIGARVPPPV